MTRLLFITPYYPPDLGPSAPLVSMLCERLAAENHSVSVIAAAPHYPSGIVAPYFRKKAWQRSVENGVEVWRVWVPSGRRDNLAHRLLVFIIYQLLAVLIGLRLSYDAAIVTNPAIETGLPFAVLCWLRRKPAIYCVWDLYPEIGIELGLFRDPLTIAIVKGVEDFCLRRAAGIQALAETFLPGLIRRVAHTSALVHIPPWTDAENLHPTARKNSFSDEHGLDDDFVVLYAGNLGYSQNLESILRAAQILREEEHLRFVFVGDGPTKSRLQQEAQELGLDKVIFLPFQPRERLPEVLSTADLALVSLQAGIATHSIPSKTLSLMACGRPILACVEEGSDLYNLIHKAQAGVCVRPGDAASLAAGIISMKNDLHQRASLGRNGLVFVKRYRSAGAATSQFQNLLLRITGQVEYEGV